jgi:hypothetical protein
MDALGLCKPSSAILLVSVAGALYSLLAGRTGSVAWWALVGIFGTGVFQALCFGGLEPLAWVLMSIPVLIVCFFIAVAVFASSMRIENVEEVPCCGSSGSCGGSCGGSSGSCGGSCGGSSGSCGGSCGGSSGPRPGCCCSRGCPVCPVCSGTPIVENFESQPIAASATMTGCPKCEGKAIDCPYCAFTKDTWAAEVKTQEAGPVIESFHPHGCGCRYCAPVPFRDPVAFCNMRVGARPCDGKGSCPCGGAGTPYCDYRRQVCADCAGRGMTSYIDGDLGRGCALCGRRQALATY